MPTGIGRSNLDGPAAFAGIVAGRRPIVMQNVSLGDCLTKWTLHYLKTQVGTDRQVVVHEANTRQMNFLDKNFAYTTKSMARFIDDISQGSPQYLRSLAAEKPSNQPADFAHDFPSLAQDFVLPTGLQQVVSNVHSSVLRISGPVNMWLHYDVRVSSFQRKKLTLDS